MSNKGDGEEKNANDDDGEKSTQTKVGAMSDVAVSCSKIVLLDIFTLADQTISYVPTL